MTLDEELRLLMQELTDDETAELLSALSAPVDPEAEARIRRSVLEKRISSPEEPVPVIRHHFRLVAAAAAIICPIVLTVAAVHIFSKKQPIEPVLPNETVVTEDNAPVQTGISGSESATPGGTVTASAVTAQTTAADTARSESSATTADSGIKTEGASGSSADTGQSASVQSTTQTASSQSSGTRTTASGVSTTAERPRVSSEQESVATSVTHATSGSGQFLTRTTTAVSTTSAEKGGMVGAGEGDNRGSGDQPVEGADDPEETTTTTTTYYNPWWQPQN